MQRRMYQNVQVRSSYAHNEEAKKVIKFMIYNRMLHSPATEKSNQESVTFLKSRLFQELYLFKKNSSLSRIQNLCIVSKKANSVSRVFRLNRTKLKYYASKAYLPGIRRSS
jgi:ribosomal protein S14